MTTTRRPRYSKEEFAKRGDALYETKILPTLKKKDDGKFLALDIETSEYEIADDELAACRRLRVRIPDAQIWLTQIGAGCLHRFGHSASKKKQRS